MCFALFWPFTIACLAITGRLPPTNNKNQSICTTLSLASATAVSAVLVKANIINKARHLKKKRPSQAVPRMQSCQRCQAKWNCMWKVSIPSDFKLMNLGRWVHSKIVYCSRWHGVSDESSRKNKKPHSLCFKPNQNTVTVSVTVAYRRAIWKISWVFAETPQRELLWKLHDRKMDP